MGDADAAAEEAGFANLTITASDGLRLNVRDYGPPAAEALPVVCLPGLARTAADFHDLALALASNRRRPRRVLALDYRGRGRSERDRNWRHYDVRVEAADTLQVVTAAGIDAALCVGTSRGGLVAMAIVAIRPALVRGVVLNDIGPVIDARGLMRIRNYIGKMPRPTDWREARLILRRLMDAQFPRLSDDEWDAMARRTWTMSKKGLRPAYDPALMKTLHAVDLEAPLPPLWFLFEGLKHVPVLALRGANSDILSEKTLAEMGRRHPDLEAHTIADQGHAPLLSSKDIVQRIARFLAKADGEADATAAG